jgi:YegS/Rv2252/BmrU family lipid kinase
VIVNPASRAGATARTFPRIEPRVREALGPMETVWTKAPGDAGRLAEEAARGGVDRIVVAGGDGTTGEVVGGVIAAECGDRCDLGLLPLGTGGDLARTLGIPRDVDGALALLARGARRRIDAARVHYHDDHGREQLRYLANTSSAGMSGLVTQLVTRGTKRLGATASFLAGTVRGLLRFRPAPVRIRLDGREIYEGDLVLAAFANGRYFGGGMKIAPQACIDDGLLDVIVIPGLPKHELFRRLPQLYTGSHVDVPGVLSVRGRYAEIEPLGEPQRIEVDGEPAGCVPERVELLPGAIGLVGVPA